MATFKLKTKNKIDTDKKPRIYFTCHPDDLGHFKNICEDIFKTHDCIIRYTEDMTESIDENDKEIDLGRNNLFLVPVTRKLLSTPNRTMDEDIPYALKKHIPVLPIMMEAELDSLYEDKFGELQYLYPYSTDISEVPYEEKLKNYLEAVLVSKETANRIRSAFDGYIFLSYRKTDRSYANELMKLIHSDPKCRDIAVWFDEFLIPGESFTENIKKIIDDCKLFTLLVTERLFEKITNRDGTEQDNYVIRVELPLAQMNKKEKGTDIFAIEMEGSNKETLLTLVSDIGNFINSNDKDFQIRLWNMISKFATTANDTPEHNFLIGLAYLDGIDVEVNRDFAVELITKSANDNLPEAMFKLVTMYTDGVGVEPNQDKVKEWSKKLANFYFNDIFSGKLTFINKLFSKRLSNKSKKKILELFSNYNNAYWFETIKAFLVTVDRKLPLDTIKALYKLFLSGEICEYTLFFDACKDMSIHREETQIILVSDILKKSANGTYPPYGPLFWYVPEYKLYKECLFALNDLTKDACFAEMLALTRDVCFIMGGRYTAMSFTSKVSPALLYDAAKGRLSGVRRALCELFYLGSTDYTDGEDVYPRCFNAREAKGFMENGCGILGRMTTPFSDELKLFSHHSYNELNCEHIGLVSCPYKINHIEGVLSVSSRKLSGLILSPSDNTKMEYIAINKRYMNVMYVPENIESFAFDKSGTRNDNWNANTSLLLGVGLLNDKILYFSPCVSLPNEATAKKSYVKPLVEAIREGMFNCCDLLISINIPNGITEIGDCAFERCRSLSTAVISNSVEKIGNGAFRRCNSLTSINIPDSVTEIGASAFYNCSSLVTMKVPGSVKQIDVFAFSDCILLEKVHISKNSGITVISQGTFKKCISLTSINIPNGVEKIDNIAFSGCSSLDFINIPDSVTEIGEYAFRDCCSLRCIRIPDSVAIIGIGAFYNCTKLENIEIPERFKNDVVGIFGSISADIISFKSSNCKKPNPAEHMVVKVPYGTTEIKEEEFEDEIFSLIMLPTTITKIEKYAFKNCISLTSIIIPNNVNFIGIGAFQNCCSLGTINIPSSISKIESYTFDCCKSLSSIIIPANIVKIGIGAFFQCTALISVTFLSRTIPAIEPQTFSNCYSLKLIDIPDSVSYIGPMAFYSCSSLKHVILHQGITKICRSAFANCLSLESIDIPIGVTEIEDEAFCGCSSLKRINIPDSVVLIGRKAFNGCNNLRTIEISEAFKENIAQIFDPESLCFVSCRPLSEISLCAKIERTKYEDVTISYGKTFISAFDIKWAPYVKTITIPKTVKVINNNAFTDCISLTSIEIPESVNEIGKEAFKGCDSLKSVVIPSTVRIIGDRAFIGCSGLTSVRISRKFEDDIKRIFGDIYLNIISYID